MLQSFINKSNMSLITSIMIFSLDTFEEKVFKEFILSNFKVGISYLVLNLKFKDNNINTSVYKLEEFISSDIEYIEGIFLLLKARIYTFS